MFEAAFGLGKTEKQVKAMIGNYKLRTKRNKGDLTRGKLRAFTNEQKSWIEEQYRHTPLVELTQLFNKRFKLQKTAKQIGAFIKNHGITSGRTGRFERGHNSWNKGRAHPATGRAAETQFKKGDVPVNHRPVGSERVNRDGYIEVKTAEPRKWELKHRVVWRRHFGEPKGIIRFRDGNSLNTDINNLVEVTRAQHAILNKFGLTEIPAENEEAIFSLVHLIRAIRSKAKPSKAGHSKLK